ncbi:hypothetical protein K437DRAFT_43518 [Tilletiaria anomala UBC 951]|uniref:Uncharacterized protein n=1 Tax=Tilletiaria anomala (strain ATCC 24038 / CBS 436.72 / UBC 951) TaxID=1037660 RepID=A0A066V6N6_TILAU|nr:uncharacterized protein K437DRAFT_43518 [Tilletiaria anomala UBC 951]KDN37151.1 hypothetical protein K437DRAFT_43518 [Tilletiaria anomala UBC 951]
MRLAGRTIHRSLHTQSILLVDSTRSTLREHGHKRIRQRVRSVRQTLSHLHQWSVSSDMSLKRKSGDFVDQAERATSNEFTHLQDLDVVTRRLLNAGIGRQYFLCSHQACEQQDFSAGDFGGRVLPCSAWCRILSGHGYCLGARHRPQLHMDLPRVWIGWLHELLQKCPAPRANDGPRHTWSHPNGVVIYIRWRRTLASGTSLSSSARGIKNCGGARQGRSFLRSTMLRTSG